MHNKECKRKVIKLQMGGEAHIHNDEIVVEMMSAMGLNRGVINMPKKMEELLIKAYNDSGAVEGVYMYINGKEITDGKNHNPFYQQ